MRFVFNCSILDACGDTFMRIITLVAIFALTSTAQAAVVITSVSIQGYAVASQGYAIVNSTGQFFGSGTATDSKPISITSPVTASISVTASPYYKGSVPPGAGVDYAPDAQSSASASLSVGNGSGISWGAGGSAHNGAFDTPLGTSSAYVFVSFDVFFQVTQTNAIFSYQEQQYYNFGASPFAIYSGSNLIVNNHSAGITDPTNVTNFLLSPGTYEYKGSFSVSEYDEYNGSSFGSGSATASITAVPEVSSMILNMAAMGVICIVFPQRKNSVDLTK